MRTAVADVVYANEDGSIRVIRERERAPRDEAWYALEFHGRDRQALWADPEAARAWGERLLAEERPRDREEVRRMETTETPDPTLPEEPETPEETPSEPEKPEDDGEDEAE